MRGVDILKLFSAEKWGRERGGKAAGRRMLSASANGGATGKQQRDESAGYSSNTDSNLLHREFPLA